MGKLVIPRILVVVSIPKPQTISELFRVGEIVLFKKNRKKNQTKKTTRRWL